MKKIGLYKHKENKDVAIDILAFKKEGKADVTFYNLHSARVTGLPVRDFFIGVGSITLDNWENYEEVL